MFDYEKFGHDVVWQMEAVFGQWSAKHDDLYIFSLDCAEGMESIGAYANTVHYLKEQAKPDSEDYWYEKYCEDEWELCCAFEAASADMNEYLEENDGRFTDPETYEYTEAFDEHCEKMIECCQNALIRFRQQIGQNHSNLLLALRVGDYLDAEGKIEIFQNVNSGEAVREYSEHIDEFV